MSNSTQENTPARAISLDELTALCDEMVSLSRAGIPLDRGLLQLANDLPQQMSVHARQVGEQLQAGKSLADVVSSNGSPFPTVYKSVVEAGLRSGKLTVALEGFARVARHLSEIRRLVISSLIYPLFLLTLMFIVSTGLLTRFGPAIKTSLISLRGRGAESSPIAQQMEYYATWSEMFWLIPAVLLAAGFCWLIVTLFATGGGFANWVPGVRNLLRNSRLMAFTEVLKLLIQQNVPLHEAVKLAGASSGDRRLEKDSTQLAKELERGGSNSQTSDTKSHVANIKNGIPPFIRWSLKTHQQSGQLEATLSRAHQTYSRRTEVSATWLRRTFPIMLSATLGGVVALLYAATVFFPWYAMLQSLADAMETM